ncbi:MAG: hypothetical protein ACXVQV_03360 [Actinomycetota bacterium]
MMNETCELTRELLPELALGTLGGEDRARSLDHVLSCADCSAELAALSRVADGLLTLAPQQEPPAGFEDRVLAQFRRERPRRRARRIAAFAAAAAVVAALATGGTLAATSHERGVAAYYQRVLGIAHGTEFAATALQTPDQISGGEIFTYEGKPSWIFVVVRAPIADGSYQIRGIVDGSSMMLGAVRVEHGMGNWGGTTTVAVQRIGDVSVVGTDGAVVLHGRFVPH